LATFGIVFGEGLVVPNERESIYARLAGIRPRTDEKTNVPRTVPRGAFSSGVLLRAPVLRTSRKTLKGQDLCELAVDMRTKGENAA
jgi:hypothetical protein